MSSILVLGLTTHFWITMYQVSFSLDAFAPNGRTLSWHSPQACFLVSLALGTFGNICLVS